MTFDLAIVGAGFAGLACAKSSAERGLRVVVIDRKHDLSQHLHTTGIFVQEALECWPLPSSLIRPISDVRLYSPSLRHIDLSHPRYRFFATDTGAVLQHMAQQVQSLGVGIRMGTAFDGLVEAGDAVELLGTGIRARFLIGADGARSRVAKASGLSENTQFLRGAEYEYDALEGLEDKLHCFLDPALAPGYIAWVMPSVRGAQGGLACKSSHTPDMSALLQKLSSRFDFSRAKITERRGGWIPVGGILPRIGRDRILLIGDAAGMVSPLTAGGIHTALYYGARAGNLVADYLSVGEHPYVRYVSSSMKQALRFVANLPIPAWGYEIALSMLGFKGFAERIFYRRNRLPSQT